MAIPKEKLVPYRSKAVVLAIPYEEGMEDGFQTRYGTLNGDGSFSTLSLGGNGGDAIQVPYVLDPDGGQRKVLCGHRYVLFYNSEGKLRALPDFEFDELYTKTESVEDKDN